jgi:hypothetical protein
LGNLQSRLDLAIALPLFEDQSTPSAHRLRIDTRSRALSSSQFRKKSADLQRLINEALDMLQAFGVPMTDTGRRRESMAMAFIAVAGVRSNAGWPSALDFNQGRSMTTRDVIDYRNQHLGETGSSGSYDDIRREDLKLLIPAGIVVRSLPGSSQNTPTRGYACILSSPAPSAHSGPSRGIVN